MIDLSADGIKNAASKYLTDTTQGFLNGVNKIVENLVSPQDRYGYGGYAFDIIDEEQTRLESEITDHYVEDNTSVQDNIALKPIEVVARGFIGEHVFKESFLAHTINNASQQIKGKLQPLGALSPKLSSFATKAFDKAQKLAKKIDEKTSKIQNLYNLFNNLGSIGDSEQAKAYVYFASAWENRQLFRIQTPYCFYNNMAIKSLKFIQSGQTKDKSQIEITFKQIRKTKTAQSVSQGRRVAQTSERVNAGLIKGAGVYLKSVTGWGW